MSPLSKDKTGHRSSFFALISYVWLCNGRAANSFLPHFNSHAVHAAEPKLVGNPTADVAGQADISCGNAGRACKVSILFDVCFLSTNVCNDKYISLMICTTLDQKQ